MPHFFIHSYKKCPEYCPDEVPQIPYRWTKIIATGLLVIFVFIVLPLLILFYWFEFPCSRKPLILDDIHIEESEFDF
jgi:hypothetical protein